MSVLTFLLAVATPHTAWQQQQNDLLALLLGSVSAVISVVVGLVFLVAMWRLFGKAGRPGWAAIVPIYNVYTLVKVAGHSGWWLVLFFLPFVNFIALLLLALDIAVAFGKSRLWGLVFNVFLGGIGLLILGLGGAQYVGRDQARPAAA